MSNRPRKMTIRVAPLIFAALTILPGVASAQSAASGPPGSASTSQLNSPINLDVKSANLYYALTLLFDQLKVGNYTLPETLKQMEVSAHFTNLPLRAALETLLKNSGYSYNVNDGVYSVVPKVEDRPDLPVAGPIEDREPAVRGKKVYRLSSGQLISNVVDIVTRLGGRVLPSTVGAGGSGTGGLGGNRLGGQGGGLGGGQGGFGGMGSGAGGFGGGLGGFGGTGSASGFGGSALGGSSGRGGGGF